MEEFFKALKLILAIRTKIHVKSNSKIGEFWYSSRRRWASYIHVWGNKIFCKRILKSFEIFVFVYCKIRQISSYSKYKTFLAKSSSLNCFLYLNNVLTKILSGKLWGVKIHSDALVLNSFCRCRFCWFWFRFQWFKPCIVHIFFVILALVIPCSTIFYTIFQSMENRKRFEVNTNHTNEKNAACANTFVCVPNAIQILW